MRPWFIAALCAAFLGGCTGLGSSSYAPATQTAPGGFDFSNDVAPKGPADTPGGPVTKEIRDPLDNPLETGGGGKHKPVWSPADSVGGGLPAVSHSVWAHGGIN